MSILKPYILIVALASTGIVSAYATPEIEADTNTLLNVEGRSAAKTALMDKKARQQQLLQDAIYIKQSLAYRNYQAITPFIHPKHGVRFSMYAYVDPKTDKTFSRAQFSQYLKASKIKFTWGDLDGTGDLYITPLPDYLNKWVDGSLYKSVGPTLNKFQGSGNSLNNLKETYPNADVVEFYHGGSEQYGGMDWRVLRLVFDEYQGRRYLVAIINDQWTI